MNDTRYLAETKKELQHIFRPKKSITDKAEALMAEIRKDANFVVGVHIRHGDYKGFYDGRFYYTLDEFRQYMQQIQQLYSDKRIAFFISSNESFCTDLFIGCTCYRFDKEPSGDILDLYALSLCDRIIGPWSTYSRWASFIGEVPLCCFKGRQQQITNESFSVISDFYHYENGESTINYWKSNEQGK